jgi:hypothetical protein
MNTGNSVRDVDPRCAVNADLSAVEAAPDSVSGDIAASDGKPSARPRPSFQHVEDIQELIDKLAAVTKQLRQPGHS